MNMGTWGAMATDEDETELDEILERLKAACTSFDHRGAAEATTGLIGHIRAQPGPIPAKRAIRGLKLLRRRRHFDLMEQLGDALILAGQTAPTVRRLYAQSQLDQGNISSAVRVLEELRLECEPRESSEMVEEYAEAVGLLGRAYKQQYVDAGHPEIARNRACLERAIEHYASVFETDENRVWHGVNTFALLVRAKQDAVQVGDRRDSRARELASRLASTLDDRQAVLELDMWSAATGVELHYGMAMIAETKAERAEHLATAEKFLSRYAKDENADAFELASTLRQLTEVWGLRSDIVEDEHILGALRTALLSREGGEIVGLPSMLDAALSGGGFEKVFGTDGFISPTWIDRCRDRLRSVCRIATATGTPVGTGFLIAGEQLAAGLPAQHLVLTNNHVMNSTGHPLTIANTQLHFEAADVTASVADIVWESPRHELDATLLAVNPGEGLPSSVDRFDTVPAAAHIAKSRAYVIGHPSGRPLSISIHDSHMLDADDRVIHYRSPTEPGSSGSPVFDGDWNLIALHHSGRKDMERLNGKVGDYEANEGIRIDRIQLALQQTFGGGPAPAMAVGPATTAAPEATATPTASPAGQPERVGVRTVCDLNLRDIDLRDHDQLEPGDIVVFRNQDNWMSKVITALDGHWSHASIYVGGDRIAHAHAGGIDTAPLADVAEGKEGYAAARPDLPKEVRDRAAQRAVELADLPGTQYSGHDLGLAFAVLCRLKLEEVKQVLADFDPDDIGDEGLEGLGGFEGFRDLWTRAEVEHTCSGFVYECYARGTQPLSIVPARGIQVENGMLVFGITNDESYMEALAAIDDIEDDEDADDGLELALTDWAKWKPQLKFLAKVGVGMVGLIDNGGVPLGKAVTPADLWCSPTIGDRWFLDQNGRAIALDLSQHCPA